MDKAQSIFLYNHTFNYPQKIFILSYPILWKWRKIMNPLRTITNMYVTKKEPLSIVHFVTNVCNARCKHCFIDFDHPDIFKGQLTLEEIKKLTKSLGKSLINVNLTGGEPLLRNDFFEIIEAYFTNTPIKSIYITSNGMYTELTKKLLDKFIASRIKGKIIFSFSIDGIGEDHDKIRKVKGLYTNVIRTYRMVQGYGRKNIEAKIGITVTDQNYDKVVEVYRHLRDKMGIKGITAGIMREEGVVKRIDPEVKKKIHEGYTKLIAEIHSDLLSGKMEGYKRDLQGRLINAKNLIVNNVQVNTYLNPHYVSHCPAAALFGVIGAKGEVYPCEILDKKLGNLRDYGMDFMKLWNNQKCKEVKKFIKDTNCNCSYECAWSINVISNKKYIPGLIINSLKQKAVQHDSNNVLQ